MEEIIPLSALNQYAYCPRRCYLIHSEQIFIDNIHTQNGNREHERTDSVFVETREGMKVERALPVFNDYLGITGRCDVVEFYDDGRIFPVEYKYGKKQKWNNDDIQLTAQMLCLEYMFKKPVTHGAVYHIQSKRRRQLIFTSSLIAATKNTITAVREILSIPVIPKPTTERQRCGECSLHTVCQPEAFWHNTRFDLFEADKT